MNNTSDTLKEKLETFILEFPVEHLAKSAANELGSDESVLRKKIETNLNETRIALDLTENKIQPSQKILEFGGGSCIFYTFLKLNGFNVYVIEPDIEGFSENAYLRSKLFDYYLISEDKTFESSTQCLEFSNKNKIKFDLIFSLNVLEHVSELSKTFKHLKLLLTREGEMWHIAPNYNFPYEPHLGIPLFFRTTILFMRIFGRTIDKNIDVWNSLNFLTYQALEQLSDKNDLNIRFYREGIYNACKRFSNDQTFRQRHDSYLMRMVMFLLNTLRFRVLFKLLPLKYDSPMKFSLAHR